MTIVSCSSFNAEMNKKQDALLACDGQPLAAGTMIPSCEQVNQAIDASASVADGTTITGVGTASDPFKVARPVPAPGTDGQVLTVQPDGSFAWETPAPGGTTEVADGTTITGVGTASDPFKVAKAPALEHGNWSVKPTADGKLGFYCNGVLVASLDCSGNFTASGNISGYCTP